jgi:hypothetical protein
MLLRQCTRVYSLVAPPLGRAAPNTTKKRSHFLVYETGDEVIYVYGGRAAICGSFEEGHAKQALKF